MDLKSSNTASRQGIHRSGWPVMSKRSIKGAIDCSRCSECDACAANGRVAHLGWRCILHDWPGKAKIGPLALSALQAENRLIGADLETPEVALRGPCDGLAEIAVFIVDDTQLTEHLDHHQSANA